jgi:hypothetical protein
VRGGDLLCLPSYSGGSLLRLLVSSFKFMMFSLNQTHLVHPSRFPQSVCTLLTVQRDCIGDA